MAKILSVYNRLQAGDYENGNGGKRRVSRLIQFIHATINCCKLPKVTRLSPDVSFASVSFAVDDVGRHVVPRAAECVHPRDRVQLLRRAEVAQLHVTDVVSQYVGTYHSQFACLYMFTWFHLTVVKV